MSLTSCDDSAQGLISVLASRPYVQRKACFELQLTQGINIGGVSTNFHGCQDCFVLCSGTEILNLHWSRILRYKRASFSSPQEKTKPKPPTKQDPTKTKPNKARTQNHTKTPNKQNPQTNKQTTNAGPVQQKDFYLPCSLLVLKSPCFSPPLHWQPNICLSIFVVKAMMAEELQCLRVKWTAPIFSLGIQNTHVLKKKKISSAELLIRENTMTCHLWPAFQVWQWQLAFRYFCPEFTYRL